MCIFYIGCGLPGSAWDAVLGSTPIPLPSQCKVELLHGFSDQDVPWTHALKLFTLLTPLPPPKTTFNVEPPGAQAVCVDPPSCLYTLENLATLSLRTHTPHAHASNSGKRSTCTRSATTQSRQSQTETTSPDLSRSNLEQVLDAWGRHEGDSTSPSVLLRKMSQSPCGTDRVSLDQGVQLLTASSSTDTGTSTRTCTCRAGMSITLSTYVCEWHLTMLRAGDHRLSSPSQLPYLAAALDRIIEWYEVGATRSGRYTVCSCTSNTL